MGIKRNLGEVLSLMIAEIPKEHEFRFKLEKMLNSVNYTAPEHIVGRWAETQAIISEEFKSHTSTSTLSEWEVAVMEIWLNKRN